MPVTFYLWLHLTGIFLILAPLGGACAHVINGGTREFAARKQLAMLHGLGLVITLIAGFGLLTKTGAMQGGMPVWAFGKLAIWLILGGLPALIYRQPKLGRVWLVVVLGLAAFAAFLAVYKPA